MGGASRLLGLLVAPFPHRLSFALRLARRSGIPLVAISPAIATSSSLLTRSRSFLVTSLPRVRFGFPLKASAEVHTQAAATGHAWGRAYHPWPEWSNLVEHLVAGGYSDCRQEPPGVTEDDSDCFACGEDLTEEFVDAAKVCLCFARDRPDLLRLLPMKEIEIILENCSPILFKNGANSTRRLKSYVSGDKTNVPCSDIAGTVDLMRYLLSNAWKSHIKENDHVGDGQLIERSSRFFLAELVKINVASHEQRPRDLDFKQAFVKPELNSRPPGLNMEMKRGDWVCPKCSFMNFARNVRCLECNEARPKRVLSGGEWERPQCPGDAASHDSSWCYGSSTEQTVKASNIDNFEIKRKLAANDEKAERWFSKMSQIGDNADLNSAIADEDFPEIMPMRKGVNRFVVSTRKTPLERRLANAQSNSSSGNSDLNRKDSNNYTESSIRQSLDRILGRSTTLPGMNNESVSGGSNTGTWSKFPSPDYIENQGDRGYVPFVPLPTDMFNKSQNINSEQSHTKEYPASLKASMLESSENTYESKNDRYLSNSVQILHKKTEGLDNVMYKANRIPNNDSQEVTPMQKGESLSLKSRRDQPFTSPQYKRRTTVEQANSSDFVPFPPDYFAKKDKQTDASPTMGSASEGSAMPEKIQSVPQKWEESTHAVPNLGFVGSNRSWHPDIGSTGQSNVTPRTNYSLQGSSENNSSNHSATWSSGYSRESSYADIGSTSQSNVTSRTNYSSQGSSEHWGDAANSARLMDNNSSSHSATWSSGYSGKSSYADGSASHGSWQQENRQNSEESWTPRFTGKSLEGSAVSKEPDPLDMSEEAKAARWFRRVAQIKDISELSNIPDEDFPEIMPMRKGVNRFVVSKRKTPLERRLTSPQYRRNLPIISSDPEKDDQQKDD